MATIIGTGRLQLREIEPEDDVFMHELMNEPKWLEFIGDRRIHGPAQARTFITARLRPSYTERGFGFYLVLRRADGVALGICGLIQRDALAVVDLGFALLERHCGQGYALEAARAVIDFARDVLSLRRLAAITRPENLRSIGLIERLELEYVGSVRLAEPHVPVRVYLRAL